jgi:polysaccharide biosynthesis transport protein
MSQVRAERGSLIALERTAPLRIKVSEDILQACRGASLQVGGPSLTALGVTSAIHGEGRSLLALAMAYVHAQDYGRKVLLVDLDMERPALARLLGAKECPGLAEVVREDITVDEAVQPIGGGLSLLSSGVPTDTPVRIIADMASSGLIEHMGRDYDIVIGDLPPIISASHGRLAASLFPKLVLVVRAGVTPLSVVQEASQNLGSEPAVILNCERTNLPRWARRLTGWSR